MIAENYRHVLECIARSARAVGRDPASVKLVVVTKGHSVATIEDIIAAGACDLGENYLEEAAEKARALSAYQQVKWHMIGHVQSRKARAVCEIFDRLHSLDSLKLARRLDRFAAETGRQLPVMLECNVSGEQTKFGLPAWDESSWPKLLADVQEMITLPNLKMTGLMMMAPFLDDPEEARPYFQRLRRLQGFFAEEFPSEVVPQAGWEELSMGMSSDFEVAIREGATIVRIGTAILGRRST